MIFDLILGSDHGKKDAFWCDAGEGFVIPSTCAIASLAICIKDFAIVSLLLLRDYSAKASYAPLYTVTSCGDYEYVLWPYNY